MNLDAIPAGKSLPEDFNVVIEISAHALPVKYEVDKDSGALLVDRFMPAAMHYPCNYGFIPNTLAEDGDPADVLVLTPYPVVPAAVIRCRPVGMLRMSDEAGLDCKILAVPVDKLSIQMQDTRELDDVPKHILDAINHFFEHYKDLEPGKWVKIESWESRESAEQEIMRCVDRYTTDNK